MESFFSRYKNALVLIVVLLAQVIGVAIQVRRPLPREHAQPDAGGVRLIRYWAIGIASPPERLIHWLGSEILGVWDNYIDLIHVRQQNKDLQAELNRLRIEQGGIAEDAWQGQRLQQLLSFEQKYIYQTVPAQVIGSSGTEQSRILSINKGSKDGVGVDMPVITPDGIVGRVREVYPHTSQVLEINDPGSAAGVLMASTRIRGILRGNGLGQPQVVDVLPDDRIKAGEKVVTSGGDQIFPRGLAVGTVEKVVPDAEHDPLVDVLIRPAANLALLDEVLVITNMGARVTPRQKLDLMQSASAANVEQLKASEILAERLPSRIEPNAVQPVVISDSADAAANDGVPVLRPMPAIRPDRFSPNNTPSALALTPGARSAPQSEGHGDADRKPRPKPVAPPAGETASGSPAKKASPQIVPDDGSRPPSGEPRHTTPGASAGTALAVPSSRGVSGEEARPRPSSVMAVPHASTSSTNGEVRSKAPETTTAPRTHIVVDGPEAPVRRPTPSTAVTPGTTTMHRPAAAAGATPGTTQHAPQTAQRPMPQRPNTAASPATTAAPKRKGPELVPDDGSRPPPTMLHQTPKPRPATQPQGGQSQ